MAIRKEPLLRKFAGPAENGGYRFETVDGGQEKFTRSQIWEGIMNQTRYSSADRLIMRQAFDSPEPMKKAEVMDAPPRRRFFSFFTLG